VSSSETAPRPLRLVWSLRARDDVQEIWAYHVAHASPVVAARLIRQLRAKAHEVAQFPMVGSRVEGLGDSFRRTPAGAYVLLYHVLSADGAVRILSVRHGRRRPLSHDEIAELDEP
jgi:plasmid stabilization system protein ParE